MRKTQSGFPRRYVLRMTKYVLYCKLTLGVGWSLAGTLETGLLALFDARIASQQTGFAHGRIPFAVDLDQCARQAQHYCRGLSGDATAIDYDRNIIAIAFLPNRGKRPENIFKVAGAREKIR